MGKYDAFDQFQVRAEPGRVTLEGIFLRSTVEKNASPRVSPGRRDQQGKAVAGTAKRVARQLPHPVPLQVGKLGISMGGQGGETVSRIIDQHLNFDLVNQRQTAHRNLFSSAAVCSPER